jgi:hypothetical protein
VLPKVGAIGVVMGLGMLTLYGVHGHLGLSRSLQVVVDGYLGGGYKIERKNLEAWTTDQSGEWWIKLDENWSIEKSSERFESVFGAAEESDDVYYKKTLGESLSPSVSMGRFKVFRGEAKLGGGTICPRRECNMVIIAKPGERDMLILIFRT